jgi:hypothetical protein
MKAKKDNSWLRPRGYIHFTKKFDRFDKEDCKFLAGYVSTPKTVASHSFFPLIHRPIITRRYKVIGKDEKGHTIRAHHNLDKATGKIKSTAKERHIFYSTHLDAYIYSYYCKEILGPLYEAKINEVPGLSDCICAYRKIPIKPDALSNKNNINFAYDTFKFIKSYGECVALTFDVSAFFDSLNQKYLKQQWCKLLSKQSLPEDHHNIYKSLTRISFVEYYKVLKEFDIQNQNKLRKKKVISFCNDIQEFKKRIQTKGLIKTHPYKSRNPIGAKNEYEYIGIPQGTPISAFLSNLYMLEFDRIMFEEIVVKKNGLYKRYSDDIVVICKPEFKNEIESIVLNTIKDKFFLTINKDKVDTSVFTETKKGLTCDKPLRYLGFEFDGKRALVKNASISKFYRQMKKAVKAQAKRAWFNKRKRGKEISTARIYKHDLYKSYSHLSEKGADRSYHSYVKEAAKVMGEKAILKQLSQSWNNLNDEIKKYEKKYTLVDQKKGMS